MHPATPPQSPLAAFSTALLDLLFPPRCAACKAPLASSRDAFCPVCADAVDPVPPGCPRCGQPGPPELCGACLAHPPAFEEVRAGALFGGPLADAIHAFKYRSRPALARPLGAWLAARAPLPPDALLVSVPLGRKRRLSRGYDQAALLAAALARASGRGARRLPAVLERRRETLPQVGRTRAERSRNVARAFEASSRVRGLALFLVDDVVTTGATADACARALLAAGARSVRVVALARAE